MTASRLQLSHISKQYPAVKANDDVSLTVLPGEIHAILGENGAGKSTLMKIVFGAVQPDEGSIAIDGQTVTIRNPQEARAHGIAMVFQHFSLFETLTVAENVWLGLDSGESLQATTERIKAKAGDYGLQIDASPGFFLLAVAGLVFLLATELVDRVLVRDELEVARQLQSVLLPKEPPRVPGWLFAHSWRTANDIGGDYHRFEPLPDGRWASPSSSTRRRARSPPCSTAPSCAPATGGRSSPSSTACSTRRAASSSSSAPVIRRRSSAAPTASSPSRRPAPCRSACAATCRRSPAS
jgi:ABC-type oligopeptide transport system ATPase subunit